MIDRGGEFNILEQELKKLSIQVRRVSSHHPGPSRAESSVKRFSHVFKFLLEGNSSHWKKILGLLMMIINSSYVNPVSGLTALCSMGLGSTETVLGGPALVFKTKDREENKAFWSSGREIMKKILAVMGRHYQCYLGVTRSNIKTIQGLGLKEGSYVYYRSYSQPQKGIVGIKKLFPSFETGKIYKILGKTSALIQGNRTGKIVSRHISDLFRSEVPRIGLELPFTTNLQRRLVEESGRDLICLEDVEREARARDDMVVEQKPQLRIVGGESGTGSQPDERQEKEAETRTKKNVGTRKSRRLAGKKPEYKVLV